MTRIGTLASALALALGAGCTSHGTAEVKHASMLLKTLGSEGKDQVVQPKRCVLTVAILSQPVRDPALNEAIWSVADEQVIGAEARRTLGANGVRIGLLTGALPAEVDAVLKAPPPHQIDPAKFILLEGEPTLISISAAVPRVSLLLKQNDQVLGKDFEDASGFFRMTAHYYGPHSIALRIVPELHHGPMQKTFGAAGSAGPYAPQQFAIRSGQQEDTLRDLAASLSMQPGQVLVLGCDPDRREGLGTFLFTQPEPNTDRLLQKLVLVWAVRSQSGSVDDAPTAGDEKTAAEDRPQGRP